MSFHVIVSLLTPRVCPALPHRTEHLVWSACQQAESIEKHCRLYPAVIDRAALQAARVEAALVRSQPRTQKQEEAMPMFYIELGSTESQDI